ncbi:MAG: DUF4169 family protein [Phycisphaerales bacterium]|nr:DUF4169 family protein [Hyphomonadaceae bacterium]
MNEVINLKRVRKAKARAADETASAQNRAAFGRTKTEKTFAKTKREAADQKLDGHKRNDNDSNT